MTRTVYSAGTHFDVRLRSELGMPFVPTVFTLLARHERYLAAALDAFFAAPPADVDGHARRTREVGREAAAALIRRPLKAGADTAAILFLLERYNEVNLRSLLVTTTVARELPHPSGVMQPPLPAPSSGQGVDTLLVDVRACHGHFNVPSLWAEFAEAWPEHALAAWSSVRALPLDDEFGRARDEVLSLTTRAVAGCTGPTPEQTGCDAHAASEINRILAWYETVIATMIIEIECLRRAVALGGTAQEA